MADSFHRTTSLLKKSLQHLLTIPHTPGAHFSLRTLGAASCVVISIDCSFSFCTCSQSQPDCLSVQGPMEQRLAEFRARKAEIHLQPSDGAEGSGGAEQKGRTFIQAAKGKIFGFCSKWKTLEPAGTEVLRRMPVTPEDAAQSEAEPASPSMWKIILLLKFILWLVLLGLFVELEFGLAYFVLSMFYWIYEGTRRPGLKKKGERSAYSVFNPGCEAIQGSITAEQLERELQYRPLAGI